MPRAGDQRADRRARRLMRSTPVRLAALGAFLIAVTLLAGTVTSLAVSDRAETLDTLLVRTEPLANSAQNLYGALSVADAAAATAFIAGGLEPTEVRDRYTQAIGEAGSELIRASAGLSESDASAREVLTRISTGLPEYSGLVETARANNRFGNPVGAAYLGEASTAMQTQLLPWAEELYNEQASRVSDEQEKFVRPPLFAIGLLVLTLALLIAGQVALARRTRRTLNWGFLAATALAVGWLGWMVIAGIVSATATDRALERGVAPLRSLTSGFILAQQARADETLDLVRRGGTQEYQKSFDENINELTARFADHPDMSSALAAWKDSHTRIDDALATGDFRTAVDVATGTGASNSAAQFAAVDTILVDGISDARAEMRGNISRSISVLTGLASGAIVLMIAVAATIGIGLIPRLREYL